MSNMQRLGIAAGSFYLLLCVALAPYALHAARQDTAADQNTTAKQYLKAAAQDTKDAAKNAATATKKESRKAVNKSARATKHAAQKVQDKTQPPD
ncbi:MAG TPA: hypothetical protein VMD78_03795 [Candidatus Baltobacteraceae bacterium]|nr:hypothetical protein [Candidatus Baltobacteraceae bacterium]